MNLRFHLVGFVGAPALFAITLIPMAPLRATAFWISYWLFALSAVAVFAFRPVSGARPTMLHPRWETVAVRFSQVGLGYIPGFILAVAAYTILFKT